MIKCPKCGYHWREQNEAVEKEARRIEKKNKREEKQLRMIYLKEYRDGHTTLDFDEWVEYRNKPDEE
jgi:uncharacterized Zn finger protein (UPF0148 family)